MLINDCNNDIIFFNHFISIFTNYGVRTFL
nr:MAG TPA: hypothetical protein [Caudoviricetes sp.]